MGRSACIHHGACGGQRTIVGLCFLPPRRFQGLNAGCQVWQQVCLLPDQRGEQVSLYSPGGSRTRYVDQASFKLVPILPVLLSETGIPGHVPLPQAIIFLEQFIG